ncbi:hypothetical protein EW145_g5663 [Phellinidium pouzarii]|uniref:BHLH domain-containing protein n=1 Tax=Phellinidium pouzarii TaxID=167371 RepID=A0A4S4KZT5_9AGAM|nr:hypothetical protein EW145_g5663 [Phellinidium pouzarii]
MATASQQPSASSPSPASNVSASAVNTALQAIKDAAQSQGGSAGQVNTQDPQLVAALLHLIQGTQNQKPVDEVKEAAAETLSNLSQAAGPPHQSNIHPQLQDSGPSTHPHGPPSLGLSQDMQEGQNLGMDRDIINSLLAVTERSAGRRRGGPPTVNGAIMGSEEWSRQRKDNHKEVERRRRGNINEGINELARIVPNGTGEKAKGAILSRSVQYIHHLKENEARNIEKWTLEKLLMDQAMGDLQAQLEEVRRMWEDETKRREKAEAEIAALKGEPPAKRYAPVLPSNSDEDSDDDERNAKRPRIEA